MTTLITDLNKVADKTPDQIVAHLKGKGWIKGSDMTREQYDALRAGPSDGRIRLTERYGGRWWMTGLHDDTSYRIGNWSFHDITSPDHLGGYWFIAYGDYVDGNLPSLPADG